MGRETYKQPHVEPFVNMIRRYSAVPEGGINLFQGTCLQEFDQNFVLFICYLSENIQLCAYFRTLGIEKSLEEMGIDDGEGMVSLAPERKADFIRILKVPLAIFISWNRYTKCTSKCAKLQDLKLQDLTSLF